MALAVPEPEGGEECEAGDASRNLGRFELRRQAQERQDAGEVDQACPQFAVGPAAALGVDHEDAEEEEAERSADGVGEDLEVGVAALAAVFEGERQGQTDDEEEGGE